MKTVFGIKIGPTRRFNQAGRQIPVTQVMVGPMVVVQVKTEEKDGYQALKLGIGEKRLKNIKKPQRGIYKGAGLKTAPFYLREVRVDDVSGFKPGDEIAAAKVLAAGDLVNVAGLSKGTGFTGVMKRWGFAGGPRTHGQSDRERAPGSIGQTTTPGRVFKGKKMPGRAGGQRVVLKNLQVMDLDEASNTLLVSGLVPGARGALLAIEKIGKVAKFTPLLKEGEVIAAVRLEEKKGKEAKKESQKVKTEEKGEKEAKKEESGLKND